jgi:hypothetical protein
MYLAPASAYGTGGRWTTGHEAGWWAGSRHCMATRGGVHHVWSACSVAAAVSGSTVRVCVCVCVCAHVLASVRRRYWLNASDGDLAGVGPQTTRRHITRTTSRIPYGTVKRWSTTYAPSYASFGTGRPHPMYNLSMVTCRRQQCAWNTVRRSAE